MSVRLKFEQGYFEDKIAGRVAPAEEVGGGDLIEAGQGVETDGAAAFKNSAAFAVVKRVRRGYGVAPVDCKEEAAFFFIMSIFYHMYDGA